jgi:8-oxo-dGTP pyrophosphatase MutT (NUDIX family)
MTQLLTSNSGFILKTKPFDSIPNKSKITQVYGLIQNQKGQILVVLHQRGDYLLPGGTLEEETWIECLNRECLEEANITLKQETIKEAFYQEAMLDGQIECYQLRYKAQVKTQEEFVTDPGGLIISNKWIELDELGDYLKWGDSVGLIQQLLTTT